MKFFSRIKESHHHVTSRRGRRYPPPASEDVIHRLLHVRLRERDENNESCLICAHEYDNGGIVTMLPCGHMFHPKCIIDWLQRRNTCPICRYEFPTDDPVYEEERRHRRPTGHTDDNEAEGQTTIWSNEDIVATKRAKILDNDKLGLVARTLRFQENLRSCNN